MFRPCSQAHPSVKTRRLCFAIGWIAATVFVGFWIGIVLNLLWMRAAAQQEKPVSRLIRDLEKKDTVFDRTWHAAWPKLPDLVTRRISSFEPVAAVEIRRRAAASLTVAGEKAVKAVPALTRALNDRDISVQIASIKALSSLGLAAQSALPDLIRFFEDESNDPIGVAIFELRGQAAGAIAAIGIEDRRAIETFSRVLNRELEKRSPSPAIPSVVEAIGVVADENNGAVPVLVSSLDRASAILRTRILSVLGNVKVHRKEIVPAMIRFLWDPDPAVRLAAVDGLGNMGPNAADSVPDLLRLFEKHASGDFQPSQRIRQPVLAFRLPVETSPGGAGSVESWDPVPSVPPPATNPNDEFVSIAAWHAILPRLLVTFGKIGPNAVLAVGPLSDYYRNASNRFRYRAARARWEIDRSNRIFLACLEEGLKEPNPTGRLEIVNLSLGVGEEALPFLKKAFVDANGEVRLAVLRCLSDMQQAAVPFVIEALRDPDSRMRNTALEMMAEMGKAASQYIKQVEPLLNDPKMRVQLAAEETLRRIDPENTSLWKAGFRAGLPKELR
ncbi:MAG: HEAT repeat domain-containing protein [Verrucomicrobia bacterium]|nr:HEAT repeat domain-containing protein [Verrucomicrobiota bacterium]